MANDEQLIVRLFEDGDRALIAGDAGELSRIFADDYVQYDESGRFRQVGCNRKSQVWCHPIRVDGFD